MEIRPQQYDVKDCFGNELRIINYSPEQFDTHSILMIETLFLKNSQAIMMNFSMEVAICRFSRSAIYSGTTVITLSNTPIYMTITALCSELLMTASGCIAQSLDALMRMENDPELLREIIENSIDNDPTVQQSEKFTSSLPTSFDPDELIRESIKEDRHKKGLDS